MGIPLWIIFVAGGLVRPLHVIAVLVVLYFREDIGYK